MKLDQLKAMLERWQKEKSVTMAYEVCEFLVKNLGMEDEDGEE